MTRDYNIMLPLMTGVVISTVISRLLQKETIYTLKLIRRGVDIQQEELTNVMRDIKVRDAMARNFKTLSADASLQEAVTLFQQTGKHGFPVTDQEGLLYGMVTISDLANNLKQYDEKTTVGDIATKSPFVAYPDQTLDKVLRATTNEYGRIPVVSRDNHRQILGLLRRRDFIKAYRKKTKDKAKDF